MRIDIMTLFPDSVSSVLHESIIGRAINKGIVEVNCHQIRDYTDNKQNQVDDYPYGGGRGCVMMAQPMKSCLDYIVNESGNLKRQVIYMSPQGQRFNQEIAKRLANDYEQLILVCGHYEGVDERFIEKCVDEELSIGDFVLTGGEIAAMAICDSVLRLIPGVLADEECFTNESHWDGLLEYPQYTRPEEWEDISVPKVLLDGNHEKIEKWRYIQQLRRTRDKRPDMFSKLNLNKNDLKLASQPPVGQLVCRNANPGDLDAILRITNDAKELLKLRKIDQWQGDYPTKDIFAEDIRKNQLFVVSDKNEKILAFFVLSIEREPSYDNIKDGKWGFNKPYSTIHRIAIDINYLGSELSDLVIDFAENKSKDLGFYYIRVDTHKKNKSMIRLLRNNNYQYRGKVMVDSEPGHDPQRQGYEKVLKKND